MQTKAIGLLLLLGLTLPLAACDLGGGEGGGQVEETTEEGQEGGEQVEETTEEGQEGGEQVEETTEEGQEEEEED